MVTLTQRRDLLNAIDQKALEICSLMGDKEREEFFNFQEERQKNGEGYKKKYDAGRKYYKGVRKGEERDVYDVDGRGFNELWKLLENYATKSVNNFYKTRRMFLDEEQEDLYDIKYNTLRALRFFGPAPNGVSFSKFFPLVCKNILSTSSFRRYGVKEKVFTQKEGEELISNGKGKNLEFNGENYIKKSKPAYRTKINFSTVSLYHNVMIEDEGDSELVSFIANKDNTCEEIEFWASIPDDMKGIVEGVVGGKSIKELVKETGMTKRDLKNMLKVFANDFFTETRV